MISRIRSSGFTVIELMMVIVLVGILAYVATDVISDSLQEARFEETVNKLKAIQNAMIGDASLIDSGARISFGFLGDVGAIPTADQGIRSLVSNPGIPDYAMNSTVRFGIGWNGPYLSEMGTDTNYEVDSWNNRIAYDPDTDPSNATLTSYGADQRVGGTGFDQDIVVNIPTEKRSATVNGFICTRGGPFANKADVEMNYVDGAGVFVKTRISLVAADKGAFSFTRIPLGVRSITIYIPSSAAPTTTIGPVLVTIDKPNYTIPCNKIDTNP